MNRKPMLGGNGFAVSRNLDPKLVRVESLKPLGRETRKHPPSQIRKLQASIEQFGFVLPIVIDVDSRVIAGWGLVVAAKRLGLTEVPAVTIADLDEAKLRMLRLALNRLGEDSGWDLDALKLEFSDILEISSETDLRISGFEMGEIDVAFDGSGNDEEDNLPALNETSTPVTQLGDLWLLGEHRILCADALMCESYARLLGDERAQMVFTDPPWNIPIAGHVSGLGAIKHGDFAMGCGEMSATEFGAFLRTALGHAATYSDDGSIHFVCMHWAKIRELLGSTADLYSETKNVCVWSKTNAGMGSLYRSRHELVFVFKKGTAPHINNVELGRHGRNRTNVWTYPGVTGFGRQNEEGVLLSLHPTVKPVALVADTILDCSRRGDLVLDAFLGSGTTLIAAERTGRTCYGLELDPLYVDTIIRRGRPMRARSRGMP